MSVDATLIVSFGPNHPLSCAIESLLRSDWRGNGRWDGIPLGNAPADWAPLATSIEEVLEVFQKKRAALEMFGIRVFWRDSDIGCDVLANPEDHKLVIAPMINRVKATERITDVSWYVTRLLPVFDADGRSNVESWSWTETA